MAFNFGAFVGGFGTRVSENIETAKEAQRQQDFRLEMLAEEEATKQRLQAASDRRAQRAADKKIAGKLKARGFDQGRISFIMSQGSGYAEGIADLATAALTNGKDPNTLFTYSTDMDQFKKLSGPKRDGVRVGPVDPRLIPAGFDYSTAFKQDRDLTIALSTEKKPDREFNSLDELFTSVTEEMLTLTTSTNFNPNSTEFSNLVKKKNDILAAMHSVAAMKDTSDDPQAVDLVSQNQFNNDMKVNRNGVSGKYNLVTLEGEFQKVETGQQMDSLIAEMDAALRTGDAYDALEGESILKQQGTVRVNAAIDNSAASLGVLAKQVAAQWKSTPDDEKPQGLAKKWKMPEGKDNWNLQRMIALAKNGNTTELMAFSNFVDSLQYSDVIQVDGHLAVFTGFTQTYNGLKDHNGNMLAMPILFVGDLPDDYMYGKISN